MSTECVLHYRGATFPVSGEAGKAIVTRWHTAFPDFQFLFEDCIAEAAGCDPGHTPQR